MAKVIIEVDTATSSVSVDVDGQKLEGINDISIYTSENYDGEMEARVAFCKQEKQGEMRVSTYYSVAAKGAATASIKTDDPNAKVKNDISRFLKRRK